MESINSYLSWAKYSIEIGIYEIKQKLSYSKKSSSGQKAAEEIRSEAIIDRLKISGVSMVPLNVALDMAHFPKSMRLPRILSEHNHLVDILHEALDEVPRNFNFENMTGDERANSIAKYVSQKFSDRLSEDPKVFGEYRIV